MRTDLIRDYKYLAKIAAIHERQCRFKQAEAIWLDARDKSRHPKNKHWAIARAEHCCKMKQTIEPEFGMVMCIKCKKQYPDKSGAAEFIGWHGICAECEMKEAA